MPFYSNFLDEQTLRNDDPCQIFSSKSFSDDSKYVQNDVFVGEIRWRTNSQSELVLDMGARFDLVLTFFGCRSNQFLDIFNWRLTVTCVIYRVYSSYWSFLGCSNKFDFEDE